MAAVTHLVATASTANATSYASGSFSPASGDLLVAFVAASDTTAAGTMSSSANGVTTWTRIGTAVKASSSDTLYCFVANQLSTGAASMTVTFDCTGDTATGAIVMVAGVSGMSQTGSSAVRQSDGNDNIAGGTAPSTVFASSALTANPTLFGHINTSTGGTTPTTNWTERADTSYSTPTTGGGYQSRDSGFTGTTITLGSSGIGANAAFAVELDISNPGAVSAATVSRTVAVGTPVVAAEGGADVPAATVSRTVAVAPPVLTDATEVTNELTNPSFETNLTDWSGLGGGSPPTLSRQTSGGSSGSSYMRATQADAFNGSVYFGTTPGTASVSGLTAGATVQFSTYAKSPDTTRGIRLNLDFYTSGDVYVTSTTGSLEILTGSWARYSLSSVVPATATKVQPTLQYGRNNTPAIASGDDYDFDAVMLTKGSVLHDYFDGDTAAASGYDYRWTGTAHASTSVRHGVLGSVNVAAAVVAATASVGSPAKSAGAAHAATVVSRSVAVGSPTLAAGTGAAVTGTVVAGTASVGAPAVLAGQQAAVAPATVAATASVGSPVLGTGAVHEAVTAAAVASVGAPSLAAGTGAPLVAAVVTGTTTVSGAAGAGHGIVATTVAGTASVSGTAAAGQQAAVSAGTVPVTTTIGASPAAGGSAGISAAVVPGTASVSGAASAGAAHAAAVVTGTASVGAPALAAGHGAAPATVAAAAAVAGPTTAAGTGAGPSGSTVSVTSSVGTVTVSAPVALAPGTVAAPATVWSPALVATSNALVTPATVALLASVAAQEARVTATVAPVTVVALSTVAGPVSRAAAAVAAATVSRAVVIGPHTAAWSSLDRDITVRGSLLGSSFRGTLPPAALRGSLLDPR